MDYEAIIDEAKAAAKAGTFQSNLVFEFKM